MPSDAIARAEGISSEHASFLRNRGALRAFRTYRGYKLHALATPVARRAAGQDVLEFGDDNGTRAFFESRGRVVTLRPVA